MKLAWLGFLNNMRRAAGSGDLLPGRASAAGAPGGSQHTRIRAALRLRLAQEHRWFQVTEHDVPLPGLTRPLSILHLTDVHLRERDDALTELCRQLRGLHPDLVLITGDVVTRGWQQDAVDTFLGALPPAPLGRFAVMGNWEYWSKAKPERWGPILAGHGVRLLREEVCDLGPISLAGTDDHWAGTPEPERLLAQLPPDKPAVVMTHSPDIVPRLIHPQIGLVLAGHSHGGQVRLPGLGAVWTPRGTGAYIGGWYQDGGRSLFVSRGLGWSVAPVRLFCPPELAWIRLSPR